MAKAALVKPASVANAPTPPACSRDLSRRARSSSGSAFPAPTATGATIRRSVPCGPACRSSTHRQGTGAPPPLLRREGDRRPSAGNCHDRRGPRLEGALAAACAALGVSDHRFLGGPGHWRDSGMMGTPSNDWDGAFWRADVSEAAGVLLEVIKDVRPEVLVTYDSNGFYGHPDHIQAHR